MKLKILSLMVVAILAISSVNVFISNDVAESYVAPLPTNTDKAITYGRVDYSTIKGRFIELTAYNSNNNVIATYRDESDWYGVGGSVTVVLPNETQYINVDVAVWKTSRALTNGHWNHVFTRTLTGDDIKFKCNGMNNYALNTIYTKGTIYGSSATFGVRDWILYSNSIGTNVVSI